MTHDWLALAFMTNPDPDVLAPATSVPWMVTREGPTAAMRRLAWATGPAAPVPVTPFARSACWSCATASASRCSSWDCTEVSRDSSPVRRRSYAMKKTTPDAPAPMAKIRSQRASPTTVLGRT
jgi:hypothetical protein